MLDQNKTGTIQVGELIQAFTYPTFTHELKAPASFDMTELVLLCLTLATDAPLANSTPFTTTIQQCLDCATCHRNEIAGFTHSSANMDGIPNEATISMSTIANLLADWILLSLRPWFQATKQRQPHRHRRIPKGLFAMLKLLRDNTQRRQVCEHVVKFFRIYIAQRSVIDAAVTSFIPDGGSLLARVPDFAALLYTFVLFRLTCLRYKRARACILLHNICSNEPYVPIY